MHLRTILNRRYCALILSTSLTFTLWSLWTRWGWASPEPAQVEPEPSHPTGGYQVSCDKFPVHLLSDIQIVLRLGSSQPADQVDSHINYIAPCIDNLILISDREENIRRFQTYDIIANLPPAYQEHNKDLKAHAKVNDPDCHISSKEGWRLDRFKFLPMVEYVREQSPAAKWFVFIEADTYVVWDTLFRLLAQYDSGEPLYMGSPTPGRPLETGEKTWFAYGGAGFVLSAAAVEKLVERRIGQDGNFTEPSISERYAELVKEDCCGDSVLGYALANKGIELSGLYPIFNPHQLHGIPFSSRYWCQPVMTLHKTLPSDVPAFSAFLEQNSERPIIYANILSYLQLETLSPRENWDNADWDGFEPDRPSPAHQSLQACAEACFAHDSCFQYTFRKSLWSSKCRFVRSIRLGSWREPGGWASRTTYTAGWNNDKIQRWVKTNKCAEPEWVRPSTKRIF